VHTQELQQEWNRCPLNDGKWIKDGAACVGGTSRTTRRIPFGFSCVRCDVRLIVGPPSQAKKFHKPWLCNATRCGAVRCGAQERRSQPGLGSPRTGDKLEEEKKKFREPRQSRSTRRGTGANRHPSQTRRLRQMRIPRWSRRPIRRMSGRGARATSCAWEGRRGDRTAVRGRSPVPPRKARLAV
jgi:hypothetical protein